MNAIYFFPVAVAIALTPGPNNFCALNNGIRQGVLPALVGTFGRVLAFAMFLTVSAVGLGAMLLASETAFSTVKWVGAAYLFYLGWRAWRSRDFSGLSPAEEVPEGQSLPTATSGARTWRALMRQEFLLGITNPKAIILFAAIFPQFIDPSQPPLPQFAVLGPTYLAAEFVASLVYAAGGLQLRRLITSQRAVVRLNKATGGFFMGAAGLLLATNK